MAKAVEKVAQYALYSGAPGKLECSKKVRTREVGPFSEIQFWSDYDTKHLAARGQWERFSQLYCSQTSEARETESILTERDNKTCNDDNEPSNYRASVKMT